MALVFEPSANENLKVTVTLENGTHHNFVVHKKKTVKDLIKLLKRKIMGKVPNLTINNKEVEESGHTRQTRIAILFALCNYNVPACRRS